MLRPHTLAYSYQGASSDPAPSPHQTYGRTAAPTFPVYPRHPTSPSHSLAPQQASANSTSEVQHPTPYPSPDTYSPLGYTTRPPFVYPQTSFVPGPSIYGSHYPSLHHTQTYGHPQEENPGTWWYFPPGTTAAVRSFNESGSRLRSNLDYPSPVPQHEEEGQSQTRAHYTSPTQTRPRTGITSSSLPTPSTSAPQTKITKSPPLSESKGDLPHERRSYHPKLPARGSEWVMWVGNVPSDVTSDELRAFFNQPLPPQSSSQPESEQPDLPQVYGGVSSVFLIVRSNCAFVNFESEAQLEAAKARFHGKPVRPENLPGPRLVCRVRKRTDDLKAGVGAQRGRSMHAKWVKEQRKISERERAELAGSAKAIVGLSSPLSTSDDDGQGGSSTPPSRSGSVASTDSGILSRYFPQRYFILKSLTQVNILSVVQPTSTLMLTFIF